MIDKLEGRELELEDKTAAQEGAKAHDPRNGTGDPADVGDPLPDADGDYETLSHRTLAEHFAASEFGDQYKYDEKVKTWRKWKSPRWREADATLMVDIGTLIQRYTEKQTLLSLPAHHGVKGLAEGFLVERFDQHPELLGLPDEVLNTTTGAVKPMTREDRITRSLSRGIQYPAGPPPDGELSQWEQFVWDCLSHYESPAYPEGSRAAVYSFLQTWCGSILTGQCTDEKMVFLWGKPGTGKGTFAETLYAMMGDYGHVLAGGRLAGRRDDHLQWLATCHGKYFVFVDEVPEDGRWRTDILNPMVSGGPLEANRMRQDSFTFYSQAHVLATGNHRPSARAASGIFRRLVIVEFQNKPEPNAVNTHLKSELAANLGDVYRWCLVGLQNWRAAGRRLRVPDVLTAGVESYRVDADPVAQFIEDRCDSDLSNRTLNVTVKALYSDFSQWWEQAQSGKPLSKRAVGMALDDLGYGKHRGREGWMRLGLNLRNEGIR